MPVTLNARDAVPAAEWNELLDRVGGNPFHRPSFIEYQRRTGAGRPLYIVIRDDSGELLAALVGYLRRPRFWPWSVRARTFQTDAFPSIRPDRSELKEETVRAIERWAAKWGVACIRLGSYWSYGSDFISSMGYAVHRRWEFEMGLSGSEPDLLSRISKKWRQKIRRGSKEGLEFSEVRDPSSLHELFSLHEDALDRKRQRGADIPPTGISERFLDGLGWLVSSGSGRAFTARLEGRAVSFAVAMVHGERAAGLFAGSNTEGYKVAASGFLFWQMGQALRDAGVLRFNLGGVPAGADTSGHVDHGLYRFKSSFASRREICVSGTRYLPGWSGTSLRVLQNLRQRGG
jgi:CelD/BcsL family acetyltransferase involved in cellulose biosynthesis